MRTKKNQVGDWVAVPLPGAMNGERPAKILEVREDNGEDFIRVRLRFDDGERDLWLQAPLPRIHWERQRGRNRWRKVA